MATVTEIGSLISRRPDIRGGRPCIAGTGVSIRRIAQWHNMGLVAEEIVRKLGHLSLAQVHAALAHYHANQPEIDADLEAEARDAEALERRLGTEGLGLLAGSLAVASDPVEAARIKEHLTRGFYGI
jgi:uncharacterized protein (DUF433 family)